MKNAKLLGVENIVIHYDSQLVANQLTGEYAARNEGIGTYVKPTHKLFKGFFLEYIERFPRANNNHTDALPTLSLAVGSELKRTIEVEFLPSRSIEANQVVMNYLEANLVGSRIDPIVQ